MLVSLKHWIDLSVEISFFLLFRVFLINSNLLLHCSSVEAGYAPVLSSSVTIPCSPLGGPVWQELHVTELLSPQPFTVVASQPMPVMGQFSVIHSEFHTEGSALGSPPPAPPKV